MKSFSIALHGGAKSYDLKIQVKEAEYKDGLENALSAGAQILQDGGSAIDAVEAAVKVMEDNPLFNAGKGSAVTSEGGFELEAAIMCGKTLKTGAVSGITKVKNPIKLARAVMDVSPYAFISGEGANNFARSINMELVPEQYFFSEDAYEAFISNFKNTSPVKNYDTVGAVAKDMNGNLAAATSTGGLNDKRFGRVGDSPLIGCGTYANNKACAVSCTGDGEYFIRAVAAHDLFSLIHYKGLSLKEACNEIIHQRIKEIGGDGGVIAIDKAGNIEYSFNSEIMFRASQKAGESPFVEIYK